MKNIIKTVLFIALTSCALGQTRKIAHKSISGTAKNFQVKDYKYNLGLPDFLPCLDSVKKLGNNRVVEYWHMKYTTSSHTDTVNNKDYVQSPIAQLDKLYNQKKFVNGIVKLIGFDEIKWTRKGYRARMRDSLQKDAQMPSNQKKQNNLWVLFITMSLCVVMFVSKYQFKSI